jgi:hypothetical protein
MLAAAGEPVLGEILRLDLQQRSPALLDLLEIERLERAPGRGRLGRRRRH